MGHRANFVVIENGKASAFEDQWAAIACTLQLSEGAEGARDLAQSIFAPTRELTDWGSAEAGYLLDFDEKRCIAFGVPTLDPETLSKREVAVFSELMAVLSEGWATFVEHVHDGWEGWSLVWDERGVDAFAEHLTRRKIGDLKTAKPSHPASARKGRIEVTVATNGAVALVAGASAPAAKGTKRAAPSTKGTEKVGTKRKPTPRKTARATAAASARAKKAKGASKRGAKPASKAKKAASTSKKKAPTAKRSAKKAATPKRRKPTRPARAKGAKSAKRRTK